MTYPTGQRNIKDSRTAESTFAPSKSWRQPKLMAIYEMQPSWRWYMEGSALLLDEVLNKEDSGMHLVAKRCSAGGHILTTGTSWTAEM